MLGLYKSLIKSHIEYCSQSWAPMTRHGNWSLILELEAVQSPVTEYPLLVAERRISLAILVSNVSRNFHFFVMFQQHFRSQQYGIGIVIYLARRRRKF